MAEEKNIHTETDLNEQMQVRLDKMHKIEEKCKKLIPYFAL